MNTPLRSLIERNFAAVEAKDLEAVLQCFAQDAVLIDTHYPSQVKHTSLIVIVNKSEAQGITAVP